DEKQFEETNARALSHFLSQSNDRAARAEAIYHMLLARKTALAEVDSLWSDDLGPLLSSAVDDLHGQSRNYLMVRLGRSVPLDVLSSLPAASLNSALRAQGRRVLERYPLEAVVTLLGASGPDKIDPDLIGVKLEA